MAVYGKENIIEVVRMQKAPYWRLIETQQKREAGNYISTSDFENPELGLEDSLSRLRDVLNKLTPGRYMLTAFQKNDAKKSGVDTWVEVETGGVHGIGSTNNNAAPTQAFIEGIGLVTLENIGEAIDKKIELRDKKAAEEKKLKDLEEENRRLKAEAREHETGINKGLLAVGSLVWDKMRGTPTGKEVIGMFNEFKKATADAAPKPNVTKQDAPNAAYDNAEVVEESSHVGDVPEAMENALVVLAEDNPDLVQQLQMLAKMKKNNPELFKDAIENLKLVAE